MKNKLSKKERYQMSIRRNLKYFLPLAFKKEKGYFLLYLFKILLNSFTPLINIYLPALIIQQLLLSNPNITKIVIYILIIILGNNLSTMFNDLLDSKLRIVNDRLNKYLNQILNYKCLRLDYEEVEDPKIKDLVHKASEGMNQKTAGIAQPMMHLSDIISSCISIGSVIVIIITTKMYGLVLITAINTGIRLLISIINSKLDIQFYETSVRIYRKMGYFLYDLMDFKFAKDFKAYNAQSLIIKNSKQEATQIVKEYDHVARKVFHNALIQRIFSNIIDNLLIYIYLVIACFRHLIDISQLTMLVSAYATFNEAFYKLFYSIFDFRFIAEYQNSFIDFMELESHKKSGHKKVPQTITTIEFKHVYFKYPRTDNYVIENFNLKIKPNERISIVGLNGAGKTTLIKLLCRLYDVDKGSILVNGINIKKYDYEEYLSLFSVVFQDFRLISFTIKDNIEGLDDNHEALYDAFTRAGIVNRIEALPDKENTYINKWFSKDGVEFSGGEMQKLAIARAIYKDGPIVILDEPTSALDPLAEAEIYYHFNEVIGNNKTTIFISHRLSSCRFANRIIVLDGKKIAEEGTHEKLMNRPNGIYRKMFLEQAKYYQQKENEN